MGCKLSQGVSLHLILCFNSPNLSDKAQPSEKSSFPTAEWFVLVPILMVLGDYPFVHQRNNHSGHKDIS